MVRFESVGLRYGQGVRTGPEVLRDLSFAVPAGGSAGCSALRERARPACCG